MGILDETTPEMLARTGGTGAHWHMYLVEWRCRKCLEFYEIRIRIMTFISCGIIYNTEE